ncbi:MAG: hypothetical protein LAO30_02310 [Acidobacteriia bacterium]|nr:hypothetical protein [Terriglobia bacterium]
MTRNGLWVLILVVGSYPARAIYGPDLVRTNRALASYACQEANFQQTEKIAKAVASGKPDDILQVLGRAMKEWRETARTSPLYPARAFCIHELVPSILEPKGASQTDPAEWRESTPAVTKFKDLGIEYYYYSPDGAWRPSKNPVDLNQLATEYLDSRWGRQAFLMMTQLGWSKGACQEGPDQFRMVIKHGEAFLAKYPSSEVSDRIRLEVANAYATWWNVANAEPDAYTDPSRYKEGDAKAKRRAIELYQRYLGAQKSPKPDIKKRLKDLQENPKGSNKLDYFCEDYED